MFYSLTSYVRRECWYVRTYTGLYRVSGNILSYMGHRGKKKLGLVSGSNFVAQCAVAQESHSHKTVAQSHKSRTKRRCATHFFDSSFIFHHFEDLPLDVSLFPHGFLFHISDQNYANFLSLILKFINLPFLTHFRVFERWCLTFCATFCATHRITLLCDYFAPCDRPFPACATVRCDPIF